MTITPRTLVATAVAVALAAGTAALSRVPFAPDRDARAALRISWRARGERMERCRHLTERELEALPAHMRQPTICDGGGATYRLRVEVDDTLRIDALVHGSGARGDRPMYVFHELPLSPGHHELRVKFALNDPASEHAEDDRDDDDEETVPRKLELEERVHLGPRDVALVTYLPERRRLALLTQQMDAEHHRPK
ncbi:MAG TPA: hypothetical protein VIR34_18500 [Gemmatimonadaceae bacterium]